MPPIPITPSSSTPPLMDAALDAALFDTALIDAALVDAALIDAAVTGAAASGATSAVSGAALLGTCASERTFPVPVNVPRRPSLAVHSIRPPGVDTCARSLHSSRNSEVCSHHLLEVARRARRSFEGLVAEAEHERL